MFAGMVGMFAIACRGLLDQDPEYARVGFKIQLASVHV
ncbi:hypothetical protein I544_1542 [Mycobacteroides abscessus subsp. bolletii 103]|nr:hypothetical protein I544_1542 [Mycobacteroides abscessus subsp. bolletii 103]